MKESAFPTPRFTRPVYWFVRLAGPLYMRLALGVKAIRIFNEPSLKAELAAFKAGKQRLIIAFRHTAVEDAPLVLMGLKGSHLSFLYGRDVLNWAGSITKFIFPRLGFIAVQNRASNREGMEHLRLEAKRGRFPLALAPEGQVTYHAHHTAPIEAGVATLALWAAEEGSSVTILPVSIAYRYADDMASFAQEILTRWQAESGIQLTQESVAAALVTACEETLALVASYWDIEAELEGSFSERRDQLCSLLLDKGEDLALLSRGSGSVIDRLFRLRFKGEDTLFNHDETGMTLFNQAKLAQLKERAHLYLRINQTVDVLEYLDPAYLGDTPTPSRMAEVSLTLLDVINRLNGGTINSRYSPKGKVGGLYIGTPLRLNDLVSEGSGRKERLARIQGAVSAALQETSESMEAEWTSGF